MKNNNLFIAGGVIVVLIIIIGIALMNKQKAVSSQKSPTMENTSTASNQAKQTTPTNTTTPSTNVTNGETTMIKISNFMFSRDTVTIKVGQKVTWLNTDTVGHTIVADDGSFQSNELNKGDSYSFTFTKVGTFTYKCGIHPNMTGKVIVE